MKRKNIKLSKGEREFKLKKIYIRSGTIRIIIQKFFNTIIVLGIFFFIFLAIRELAGKITLVKFLLDLFADVKVSIAISYCIAVSASIWALGERMLRIRNIKFLSDLE